MTTYIVKVKTEAEYLVESDDPVDAMWIFGMNDPSKVVEEYSVYDEEDNFIVSSIKNLS